MFNENLFKGKVKEKGFTLDYVAERLGINPATLSRKMKGLSDFTRNEIQLSQKLLFLTFDDVKNIFFN